MGRKPKKGLREAILSEAAEQPSSATMIHRALEAHKTEPTTLTGVIKAAERLKQAGLLRSSQAMPNVYHGARTRTYYKTTIKGITSLKNAIASATAGWDGKAVNDSNRSAERQHIAKPNDHKPKRDE